MTAADMRRVELPGAAGRIIHRRLAAVRHDGNERRSPGLARRQCRIIRDRLHIEVEYHFLSGQNTGPGASHESAVTLADSNRGRCAVDNVPNPDAHVAVEDSVERLELVAPVE